jgi:hypothetical protein
MKVNQYIRDASNNTNKTRKHRSKGKDRRLNEDFSDGDRKQQNRPIMEKISISGKRNVANCARSSPAVNRKEQKKKTGRVVH